MQLKDLVKPIDQMSNDELMERLRQMRHNRDIVRPAAKKHIERAEAKVSRGKVAAIDKLLEGMSEADREKLMAQLQQEETGVIPDDEGN